MRMAGTTATFLVQHNRKLIIMPKLHYLTPLELFQYFTSVGVTPDTKMGNQTKTYTVMHHLCELGLMTQ